MRAAGVTLLSMTLTAAVIGNAFYQKKQFYPSVVYITKSNPCMAVIYVQAFVLVILTGKLMRKVFFGQLRAAEFEHLMERSWYAVTETCLAFTVFRDDFSPKFVALFTVLLFLKSFHWLAEDRVDFMERSPVISWIFHIRVLSLLMVLGALDMHFVGHAYQSTVTKGASVQLVFGFEYAILLTIILNIGIKYVLHTLDLQSDNPWENKAVFLLYTELAMGFIKVILYITFVAIMVRIYTLPLFAFRPMYYTMRAFNKAFNDVVLSRRAIRNMNTLYPDATPEELSAADNVCIICREEMVTASKKLPCNHIFHTSCLRSWFQRQQTCPTCRLNILQVPQPNPAAQQQGAQGAMPGAPHPAAPQPPAGPAMNPFMPMMAGGFPGGMHPMWQPFQLLQQPQQQQAGAQPNPAAPAGQAAPGATAENAATPGTSGGTTQAGASTTGTQPQMAPPTSATLPPFLYPPFPMIPFMVPPPLPPRDWAGLSDEELRALEGTTREAVEARLRVLHQVLLLLDAAAVMANQCATATPHPQNPAFNPTAATSSSGASTSGAAGASVVTTPTSSAEVVTTPSTSEAGKAGSSVDTTASTSEDKPTESGGEGSLASSLEQEEIRRRRLEKFSSSNSSDPSNMREGSMPPTQD